MLNSRRAGVSDRLTTFIRAVKVVTLVSYDSTAHRGAASHRMRRRERLRLDLVWRGEGEGFWEA
jgi:hypothetical protein